MHDIMNTTNYTPTFRRAKIALGNTEPRYNSHVEGIRRSFYINSMRNSEDVPDWMNRSQNHYHVGSSSTKPVQASEQPFFASVRQKYVYMAQAKLENQGGQFQRVSRKKMRTQWEMKNHTYEFEWPKAQPKQQKTERLSSQRPPLQNPEVKTQRASLCNPDIRTQREPAYFLPKYGLTRSPLHRQKETPIKIGHKATVDSIYVK